MFTFVLRADDLALKTLAGPKRSFHRHEMPRRLDGRTVLV